MAATLEQFLPYVEPHVLGAPIPGLLQEIRETLIEFCERTRVWKAKDMLDIESGTAEYTLPDTPSTPRNVVVVEEVYSNSHELKAKTLDDLKRQWHDWTTMTGTPVCYTQFAPTIITLVPVPNADLTDGLWIRACYRPARSATAVPDFLFEQYAKVIGHGAAARMLETDGRPYGNPKMSVFHAEQFERGIHKALTDAARGFTRAPLRSLPRFM